MVTTTKEQAAAPSQPNQAQPIDDFRSLLAAVPPAKAVSLKECIYDWLEKRGQDAEMTIVKAQARATIVEAQNRIVRMELQDIESNRLREGEATTRKAKAGLFAEAMSALNAPDVAAPKEGEETSEEENDDQDLVSADYQQPTDSSATTHTLQPLGANIGKKVHTGDITSLDIVIKELLDEVVQLREGASANVARIMMLEDQLQTATVALAIQLGDTPVTTKGPYNGARGPLKSTSQSFSQSFQTPQSPLGSWGEEKERDPQEGPGAWMRAYVPSLCGRRNLRNPDPAPIRGFLHDEPEESPDGFGAYFKKYAEMMHLL